MLQSTSRVGMKSIIYNIIYIDKLNYNIFFSRKRRYFYIIHWSKYRININMLCVILIYLLYRWLFILRRYFVFHSLVIRTYMYCRRNRRAYIILQCVYYVQYNMLVCIIFYSDRYFIHMYFTVAVYIYMVLRNI